ncbi:hypothetical protein C7S14_7417 [Burkholderia cepacia]|nr:hypothetical protein C7S14_7417 [Burkholderia cepacia]
MIPSQGGSQGMNVSRRDGHGDGPRLCAGRRRGIGGAGHPATQTSRRAR